MELPNAMKKSRRTFISSCAACGACLAFTPSAFLNSPISMVKSKKIRLKIVYAAPGPKLTIGGWPHIGFDFASEMENLTSALINHYPNFEFLSSLAFNPEDGKEILSKEDSEKIDGYVVLKMHGPSNVVPVLIQSDKPILYVNYLYGGGGAFLRNTASFLRNKESGFGFVSSADIKDLLAAVKSFEIIGKGGSLEDFSSAVTKSRMNLTPAPGNLQCKDDELNILSLDDWRKKMKMSKILAIKDQNSRIAEPIMGISLEYLPFAELNHAWETADKEKADEIAERWADNAVNIIDVSSDELRNSAAMYLGMKTLLKNHNANAIAINCLGGFYGGHLHAYPCLGFHELNNSGRFAGVCECDIRSAVTMVAFTAMTGRPGYISDPVIDTSKRQIIYAHCVAPNKMFGADGQTNPYYIMTHAEDNAGASVRSVFPTGYLTTSLKISSERKEIVMHQAKAVGNSDDPRACRSKLIAEPIGDIEKLFTSNDQWQWHRVTFYGDLKKPVYDVADYLGWKVIEET